MLLIRITFVKKTFFLNFGGDVVKICYNSFTMSYKENFKEKNDNKQR